MAENDVRDFYNAHQGETCLIVGGGPNLKHTPPEWFDYPSFGCNTIFRYEGWKPTYYVGVDERLRVENGAEILERLPDVPKFFPAPDGDDLQGQNIYRFKHREGVGGLYVGGQLANHPDALTKRGILYYKIMGAVLQIAWHMGFTTMLMIGIEHNPDDPRRHFWGMDEGAKEGEPLTLWMEEYSQWAHAMNGVQVLNISQDTYVPEDIIPRGDWREWYSNETVTV